MTLPGKLCIGILEEDNPLRSYFRFKPLLVDQDGGYVPFEGTDQYPDEGCIRIVPDKNESYYFKTRMRQNGLFCVMDLREHPGESDKIRPNKNYKPGGEEVNGCIVYSDVVRGPVANMIYQVLPVESAGAMVPEPHTPRVLLRRDGALLPECHGWEAVEIAAGMALLNDAEETVDPEAFQVFDLPGFRDETISFAIVPASKLEAVSVAPERPGRRSEEKRAEPEAEKPAEPKVEKQVEPKAEKPAEPEAESPIEPKPEEPAEPEAEAPAEPGTEAAETEPVSEPEAPAPEPEPEEKPWIHRDASMRPKPVDKRLSRAQQLIAAQAGLNPRRGRSLQELIDEKWAHSRMTQLGTPVSPIATGAPVRNPVDTAVAALHQVWDAPQLRAQLLAALGEGDGIADALSARRDAVVKSSVNRELNALEAQRLELLGELERLKNVSQQTRDRLKQEILKDEASAFEDAVGKTRAAREAQQVAEQRAEDARAAARDAQGLLDELAGEALERKIRDVALTQRVAERLALLKDAAEGEAAPPEAERIDFAAFLERFKARLDAAGWQYTDFDAANLCVCLAVSPVLVLSGAPGSGKTRAAQLLAEALGACDAGRLAECHAGRRPLHGDPRVKALARHADAPAVVLLDDANLMPSPDILRGMGALPGPEWRLIATVQDNHSGAPVSAAALDRGFLVRLSVPADLPWRPAGARATEAAPLASVAALAGTLPQAEVPEGIVARMEGLRRSLAAANVPVSRRALDESWRYCAAMLALLGNEADPLEVFDSALAQRVLPALLAAAPAETLAALGDQLETLPRCAALLRQPVPIGV